MTVKLRRLSTRFQALIWSPGDSVQNLELTASDYPGELTAYRWTCICSWRNADSFLVRNLMEQNCKIKHSSVQSLTVSFNTNSMMRLILFHSITRSNKLQKQKSSDNVVSVSIFDCCSFQNMVEGD